MSPASKLDGELQVGFNNVTDAVGEGGMTSSGLSDATAGWSEGEGVGAACHRGVC